DDDSDRDTVAVRCTSWPESETLTPVNRGSRRRTQPVEPRQQDADVSHAHQGSPGEIWSHAGIDSSEPHPWSHTYGEDQQPKEDGHAVSTGRRPSYSLRW